MSIFVKMFFICATLQISLLAVSAQRATDLRYIHVEHRSEVSVAHGFTTKCNEAALYLNHQGIDAGVEGSIIKIVIVNKLNGRRAVRMLRHQYRNSKEFRVYKYPHILMIAI